MTPGDVQIWLSVALQFAMLIGVGVTIAIQIITQLNVHKIELATNSMKDALVAATDKAAGLAGEARGLANERERAEGRLVSATAKPIPVVIASPTPLPVVIEKP